MTLFYTPGQLRSLLGVSQERYRHWKKAIEPLRRHRGHSPCFTAGDLVAVATIRALAGGFGVPVGRLSRIGARLFEICNETPWPTLERGKFVIDLPAASIELRSELSEIAGDRPFLVVPLTPVMVWLRGQLLAAGAPDAQEPFRFPPVPVTSAPRSGAKS